MMLFSLGLVLLLGAAACAPSTDGGDSASQAKESGGDKGNQGRANGVTFEGTYALGDFSPQLRSLCLKYSKGDSFPVCCATGQTRWSAESFRAIERAAANGATSALSCEQNHIVDVKATAISLLWDYEAVVSQIESAKTKDESSFWITYSVGNKTAVDQTCDVRLTFKASTQGAAAQQLVAGRLELKALGTPGHVSSTFGLVQIPARQIQTRSLQLEATCNGRSVGTEGMNRGVEPSIPALPNTAKSCEAWRVDRNGCLLTPQLPMCRNLEESWPKWCE